MSIIIAPVLTSNKAVCEVQHIHIRHVGTRSQSYKYQHSAHLCHAPTAEAMDQRPSEHSCKAKQRQNTKTMLNKPLCYRFSAMLIALIETIGMSMEM